MNDRNIVLTNLAELRIRHEVLLADVKLQEHANESESELLRQEEAVVSFESLKAQEKQLKTQVEMLVQHQKDHSQFVRTSTMRQDVVFCLVFLTFSELNTQEQFVLEQSIAMRKALSVRAQEMEAVRPGRAQRTQDGVLGLCVKRDMR